MCLFETRVSRKSVTVRTCTRTYVSEGKILRITRQATGQMAKKLHFLDLQDLQISHRASFIAQVFCSDNSKFRTMQAIVRRNQTKASQPLLWVFRVLVVLSVMDDVKDFTGWTGNRRGNIFASAFSLRRNNGDQENSFFDHVLCALPFKRFCSPSYAAKQWIKGNGYNENDQQLYAMVDFYFSTRNTESSGPLYKKGWLDESNPCWWEGVICGFTNEIESIQLGKFFVPPACWWKRMQSQNILFLIMFAWSARVRRDRVGGNDTIKLGLLDETGYVRYWCIAPILLESWTNKMNRYISRLLESLYLQQNQLSDQIPSELGQITALSSLYLNGNNLSGVVPTEICGDGDWGAVYTYSKYRDSCSTLTFYCSPKTLTICCCLCFSYCRLWWQPTWSRM